jgi:hypothetical protein
VISTASPPRCGRCWPVTRRSRRTARNHLTRPSTGSECCGVPRRWYRSPAFRAGCRPVCGGRWRNGRRTVIRGGLVRVRGGRLNQGDAGAAASHAAGHHVRHLVRRLRGGPARYRGPEGQRASADAEDGTTGRCYIPCYTAILGAYDSGPAPAVLAGHQAGRIGAPEGIRTPNLLIRSATQLSRPRPGTPPNKPLSRGAFLAATRTAKWLLAAVSRDVCDGAPVWDPVRRGGGSRG